METLYICLTFLSGWLLRGLVDKLFILGRAVQFSRTAERSGIMMLSRASEHYYHSVQMLKTAGEKTGRDNEVIRTINSLEFTHKQWKKTAIEAIYEAHPFKAQVKWHDWDTAIGTLESDLMKKRRNVR